MFGRPAVWAREEQAAHTHRAGDSVAPTIVSHRVA